MATMWFPDATSFSLRLLLGYIGIMVLFIWFSFQDPSMTGVFIFYAAILTGIYLVIAPFVYFLDKAIDEIFDKIFK